MCPIPGCSAFGEADSGGTRNNRISENVKPFHDMNTNVYDFFLQHPRHVRSSLPFVRLFRSNIPAAEIVPAFSDGMPHEDILEQQITDFFVYFHLFFHKQYLLKQFFTVLSTR